MLYNNQQNLNHVINQNKENNVHKNKEEYNPESGLLKIQNISIYLPLSTEKKVLILNNSS